MSSEDEPGVASFMTSFADLVMLRVVPSSVFGDCIFLSVRSWVSDLEGVQLLVFSGVLEHLKRSPFYVLYKSQLVGNLAVTIWILPLGYFVISGWIFQSPLGFGGQLGQQSQYQGQFGFALSRVDRHIFLCLISPMLAL